MKLFEIARAMIFSLNLGIFATLTVFLSVISAMKVRKVDTKHKRVFFYYLSCATLTSAFFMAYYYFPEFFARFGVVYVGSVIFALVLFHHFLSYATRSVNPFNPLHYVVAAIVVGCLFTVVIIFPEYRLIRNHALLFYAILAFSAFYSLMCLYGLHRFYIRMSLEYGDPDAINHSRVRLFIFETLMFPLNFGLLPFAGGQQPGVVVSVLMMASIIAALTMNVPLIYAIMRHYALHESNRSLFDVIQWRRPKAFYVPTTPAINPEGALPAESDGGESLDDEPKLPEKRVYRRYSLTNRTTGEVDKTEFENYFRKNKPFLNPNLTIYDLLVPLHCNRTYLSKFINNTYGMNFSKYINNCRLQEMERLLAAPGNRHKTPAMLFSKAGFSSLRNYAEAQKQFKKIDNNENDT